LAVPGQTGIEIEIEIEIESTLKAVILVAAQGAMVGDPVVRYYQKTASIL
jgi:hypothetical protein